METEIGGMGEGLSVTPGFRLSRKGAGGAPDGLRGPRRQAGLEWVGEVMTSFGGMWEVRCAW